MRIHHSLPHIKHCGEVRLSLGLFSLFQCYCNPDTSDPSTLNSYFFLILRGWKTWHISCALPHDVALPCGGGGGGDGPWWSWCGTEGVDVETPFLLLTAGDEFWGVLVAVVAANAPVLTGLWRPDGCLLCLLWTSPSAGFL